VTVFRVGTSRVATAGTRIQLSADAKLTGTHRIKHATFGAREGNTGEVYIGQSDVASTEGWEVDPAAEPLRLPFAQEMGYMPLVSEIWFDADTDANGIDWILVIED